MMGSPLCALLHGALTHRLRLVGRGSRLHAIELHRPDIADHLLVGYRLPCSHVVRAGCGQRRAAVTVNAETAQYSFNEAWYADDFEAALAEEDVNYAWRRLPLP